MRNNISTEETGLLKNTEPIPIGLFSENDIFIVGYPKSGNTWMQNIAGGIMYGPESIINDAAVQQLVPDVHDVDTYRRRSSMMFFKTHFLPVPEYKRVVYLIRDGRDAMVSYYHYLSAIDGEAPDFQSLVETGEQLFPCKWERHVTEWMKNPFGAEMMLIRYEDLKRNPVAEMRRLCEFSGLSRSDEFLERVAMQTTFEAMRERERQHGMGSPRWPKDHFFVRRGEVGSHADEMPSTVLEAFLKEAGGVLRQRGYLEHPADETQDCRV